jgi:hypothetical protein
MTMGKIIRKPKKSLEAKKRNISEKSQSLSNKKIKIVKEASVTETPKELDINQVFQDLKNAREGGSNEGLDNLSQMMSQILDDDSKVAIGFKNILIGLMLHLTAQVEESLDSFSEIETSWKSFKNDEVSSELHWADVLIDLIISILATSSKRTASFLIKGAKSIRSHVTPAVIESFQAALSSTGDEEDDVEADENSNASDDSEDDENDYSDDEEVKDLDEFKMKLQKILNKEAETKKNGSDDEEDEEADDEEMLELDEALSEAFKERLGGSKQKKQIEKNLTSFKCRVFNLFEAIIDPIETPIGMCFPIVFNFMTMARQNSQPILSSSAARVLLQVSKSNPKGTVKSEALIEASQACTEGLLSNATPKNVQKSLVHLLAWMSKLEGGNTIGVEVAKVVETAVSEKYSKKNCVNKNGLMDLCSTFAEVARSYILSFPDVFFHPKTKDARKAPAIEVLAASLRKADQTTIEKKVFSNLWTKATEELQKCLSCKKRNPLLLGSLVQTIDALKQTPSITESLSDDSMKALSKLTNKDRKKIPRSAQKVLKSLLLG